MFFALTSVSTLALACFSLGFNTWTILNEFPAQSAENEVLAKVEVVEIFRPPHFGLGEFMSTGYVKVRVVESIRGVALNDVFALSTGGSSCDQRFRREDVGFQGYIAGRFDALNGERVFVGAWKWKRGRFAN